jgi:basic membrane lipoprotein Med (substrate-binding protein (PBP1-ABC) superfamily)
MMEQIKDGTFPNTFYQMGMEEGSIQVVLNTDLESQIPEEAMTAMNKVIADIQSGAFTVPYVPEASQ